MSIFNPVANSLFLPTAYAFSGVLAVGLGAIIAAERGRIGRIARSVLFQRWRTWVVIAPVFGLAVLAGPVTMATLIGATALVALLEYSVMAGVRGWQRLVLLASGVAVVAVALAAPDVLLTIVVLTLLALAVAGLREANGDGFRSSALAFLGLAYIPLLLAHAVLIADGIEDGSGLLLALGLAVAMSDVAAFTCGKLFGRRQLAPRVSPNKTWAGVGGNFLGAYAAFTVMHFALPDIALWAQVLLPAVVAVADVMGDLFESLLKRSFAVKDAGDWLPGFGGLLDRIDSLLFVLPVAYYFVLAVS
jgi:phosphatidate cytidylyltransferase